MLQAVVELAEEFVEQVSGSCGVPVAMVAALSIVLACPLMGGGGGECPHPADIGQPVVLDLPVGDADGPPGGAGDRGGSGVGLQRTGVGEPGVVIADLSAEPGTGRVENNSAGS